MRVLGFVLATLVASTGVVAAAPSYSRPLDDYTLERARREVADLARREGLDAKTGELLLGIDVFATSNDTGCPGVDVDIVNATSRTVWFVEVVIEQKDGTRDRTDRVHLPYMPANTQTRVTVSCVQDYTYRSRYDYGGSKPISLSYSASGSRTLDAALPSLVDAKVDYTGSVGGGVAPTDAALRGRTLLEEALALDDPDVAKELVLAISRTGVGKTELGEALADNGTGALADEVVGAMKKLPLTQQKQLARTLLASAAAERWEAQLGPMIDRQLCTGARADVVALWVQAQDAQGIPVQAYRERVQQRCKPTKADGPALAAALAQGDDVRRAGPVLDAVEDDLFASVVASWRTTWKADKARTSLPASLVAYLRGGTRPERFDAAVGALDELGVSMVLEDVARASESGAAPHKAAWLDAQVAKLPAPDTIVAQLTTALVSGELPAPAMRTAVKAIAARAPQAAEDVIVSHARTHSKVFDATKLQAAGIDMAEYLAFNASLGDCTGSANLLAECADKIAAYVDPSGPGALVKLAKTAVKSEFASEMRAVVTPLRDPNGLIALAGKLSAAGFDVSFVADRACNDARDAVRYDGDPAPHLALVEKIAPGAACIEEVKDAVTSKHRRGLMFAILAIAGLVLPLPAGGWLMRRRWRKVKAELPADAHVEAATGATLDDRLGPRVLGRGLTDGLAAARRELPDAAVALSTIDAPVTDLLAATVKRAVRAGDAATSIVRRGTDAVYLVALPVRHPRPQVVQRYLGAPWPEHVARIRDVAGLPVVALIVLCGPEATEASLLIGTAGADGPSSDPDVLLDAREARDRGANRFRHVITLAGDAASTTTSPPTTSAKAA